MQKRYRGFLKAIEQNGLEFQKENLYEATVDYESGVNAAKWFVDNKADITAVVATADVLAIGLMKGFYEQGVQVPEDISIIGLMIWIFLSIRARAHYGKTTYFS